MFAAIARPPTPPAPLSLPLHARFRVQTGHHRVKQVEELYAALDDNSVVLSTLKATKFGKLFMDEIVYW